MDKKQYGWAICMACALLLFCTAGLAQTGFSAYQPYLTRIGGLTNTQASTVSAVSQSVWPGGNAGGDTADSKVRGEEDCHLRHSALRCFLFGVRFFPQLLRILRGRGAFGMRAGAGRDDPGLSVIVASPIITLLVSRVSLRFSFFAEGAFIFLAAAVVWTVLRSRPDCLHTEPIGAHHVEAAKSYAPRNAPARLSFFMMLGILVFGMPGNNLYSYISALYQSTGFGAMEASWLLSVFGIALTAGKCIYGQIVDKMGTYRSSWILYILAALGTGLCCLARNGNFAVAAAGVILMGLGLAVTTVSISMYAAGAATEESYPATVTKYQVLSTLGALLFGVVPGAAADRTGDYVLAFVIMLILTIAGAVIVQTTYHAIGKENRKLTEGRL